MSNLDRLVARRIIDYVGGAGQPPQFGLDAFTAGIDPYLDVIEDEYLNWFIPEGGSTFKMVVGVYGGGKTHFLYCVRDRAWRHNFVVSYVTLKQGESPFSHLELVYKAVIQGLTLPLTTEELLSGYEQGIESFIRSWYSRKLQEFENAGVPQSMIEDELLNYLENVAGIESISLRNAVTSAFRMVMSQRNDELSQICQWLRGEGYDRQMHRPYGVLQRIDKTTAFSMLRSLTQWIRQIGYSGLVVLLDEAERVPSLGTKDREKHLSNLREIIDECGNVTFQGAMIFYAVPDENFLEGRTQAYEALKQRVLTVFDVLNPTGVKIELEQAVKEPIPFLNEVGNKLAKVYELAYQMTFDPDECEQVIASVAESSYSERFGDIGYKRLFIQNLVREFQAMRGRTRNLTNEE